MPENVFQVIASLVGDEISAPVGYECTGVPDEARITVYLRVHEGRLDTKPMVLIERTETLTITG